MASASSTAVWSFHSTNMALGLSANSSRSASTLPSASIGAGALSRCYRRRCPPPRRAVRGLTMPTHFSARLHRFQCSRADGVKPVIRHRQNSPSCQRGYHSRWWPAPRRWRVLHCQCAYGITTKTRPITELPCTFTPYRKPFMGETVDIHAKTVRPYSPNLMDYVAIASQM